MSDSEDDCNSDHESSNSSNDEGYDEEMAVDEFCVCCDSVPPNPSYQLQDGYYCDDCYESQK